MSRANHGASAAPQPPVADNDSHRSRAAGASAHTDLEIELLAALKALADAWRAEYLNFFGDVLIADFDNNPPVVAARAAIAKAAK